MKKKKNFLIFFQGEGFVHTSNGLHVKISKIIWNNYFFEIIAYINHIMILFILLAVEAAYRETNPKYNSPR